MLNSIQKAFKVKEVRERLLYTFMMLIVIEIWPEMVKVLKDAGICNYSIFYCNDELFGYYECEKGVAYAEKVQAESPVVDRWNAYMKDILELEMDPVTGAQPKLEQVFRLN